MRVRIHRSDRADRLAQALADVLSEPLDDPFAIEVVCVPTRGVERFLAQSLAAHLGASPGRADGICSAVDFPSPRRFRAAALARALFEDGGPGNDRDDPWRPERLAWPLLTEIDRSRGERWSELLWSYLDGPASDAQHRPNGRR